MSFNNALDDGSSPFGARSGRLCQLCTLLAPSRKFQLELLTAAQENVVALSGTGYKRHGICIACNNFGHIHSRYSHHSKQPVRKTSSWPKAFKELLPPQHPAGRHTHNPTSHAV